MARFGEGTSTYAVVQCSTERRIVKIEDQSTKVRQRVERLHDRIEPTGVAHVLQASWFLGRFPLGYIWFINHLLHCFTRQLQSTERPHHLVLRSGWEKCLHWSRETRHLPFEIIVGRRCVIDLRWHFDHIVRNRITGVTFIGRRQCIGGGGGCCLLNCSLLRWVVIRGGLRRWSLEIISKLFEEVEKIRERAKEELFNHEHYRQRANWSLVPGSTGQYCPCRLQSFDWSNHHRGQWFLALGEWRRADHVSSRRRKKKIDAKQRTSVPSEELRTIERFVFLVSDTAAVSTVII